MAAKVCQRESGIGLECLLCRKNTKEYESLLATDADASVIHAALLVAGAEPGSPVQYKEVKGETVIVPPTGNEVISMLKATTLVSVLAISDLLYSAQIIYSLNYRTIPLLIVASLWYLLMTSILSYFQNKLENHYGRGFSAPTTAKQRWLALRRTK